MYDLGMIVAELDDRAAVRATCFVGMFLMLGLGRRWRGLAVAAG
jgi:hypothetical protein